MWTGGGEVPAAPQELEATVADAAGERRWRGTNAGAICDAHWRLSHASAPCLGDRKTIQ